MSEPTRSSLQNPVWSLKCDCRMVVSSGRKRSFRALDGVDVEVVSESDESGIFSS